MAESSEGWLSYFSELLASGYTPSTQTTGQDDELTMVNYTSDAAPGDCKADIEMPSRDVEDSPGVTGVCASGDVDTKDGDEQVELSCSPQTTDSAVVGKMQMLQTRDRAVVEDESLKQPIELLPGEELCRLGRNSTGETLMLTTFRLFVGCKLFVNIALGVIENVECVDSSGIQVTCKDGTIRSIQLPSSDISFKWLHAIKQEMAHVHSFADYFAFYFYITCTSKGNSPWQLKPHTPFKLGEELKRLGFNLKKDWRITNINAKYEYCDSYPKENVVPKSFSDESLQRAGTFRSRNRFPSAVWRHKVSSNVLLRCSQPFVGLFCQRSQDDEDLVQAIIQACEGSGRVLIVDARPYASAIGNRAKGGGFEFSEYYNNSTTVFMNLPNIHAIRASFIAVRQLVSSPGDPASWYARLSATNWILNLSTLVAAAKCVANALANTPVLVHCSDGWDRTPQICALAQLLLDPFYRTFKGFQVLIIKEWLQFGHRFGDRCANGKGEVDGHEYSPIFLQWLDSVYQLTRQFPTAFEFNEAYLVKLVQHTYSRMFGTFLLNSEKEREAEDLYRDTASVWSLLDALQPQLTNKLYTPGYYTLLDASSHPRDLELWMSVYAPEPSHTSETQEELPGLQRSRSYSDISVSTESNLHTLSRRLSDPDLSSSMTMGEEAGQSSADIPIPSQPLASTSNELITHSFSSSPIVKLSLEQRSRNSSGTSMRDLAVGKASKCDEAVEPTHYSKYLCLDGLSLLRSPLTQRVDELSSRYEREIERLHKSIAELKKGNTGAATNTSDSSSATNGQRVPSSAGSDQSDESWEDVSVCEPTVTLWIPDHAVAYCCSCGSKFKMYRRKHHCRQCGLVFCISCAGKFIDIPDQQLYEPVRVCSTCHDKLVKSKKSDGPTQLPAKEESSSANSTRSDNDVIERGGGDLVQPSLRTRVDSEPWLQDPNAVSSPVGSPMKPALRDLHSAKTCSQESINNDSNCDGSFLMNAKAS